MNRKTGYTTAAPQDLLIVGLEALGLSTSPETIRQFLVYCDELLRWNARVNLTGLKTASDVVVKHFLDSLAVWPWVRDLTSLADIGTGAGFPGLALKLALPHLHLTLLEPTGKKSTFLRYLTIHLNLANVEVRQVYLTPSLARQWGPQFHGVITRAAFSLPRFLALAAPLTQSGGRLLSLKGPQLDEEQWHEAMALTSQYNCREPRQQRYVLPLGQESRLLVIWDKI
ncbi:16S rRNA (guanine(527)-N(7))-methyltransferase RsmG [Desulfobacca acetoxidans]|uniref:Ribosomal RNA small subunit methyltransferase G n=1 Tax=Desulfobacca acetoxidans (strain ATCC 700848 / DSM 11109 / ASRB2) TaxID=880072 RepID=F2NGV4_DESAR|nr:16S rRNA (guanine(527)-N(7))-methyltransferase RsmG [Desulfobacca acetoxidans]AEB08725.1 Ribosomal RNA small subunit methyltransferase G [Desulfobacca acetoxidans DSM 11109]HAY21629.1 16S rRNA (guanine(527)-N(7))-methyltransferase RsmG [Desulfobacterales bacterium]